MKENKSITNLKVFIESGYTDMNAFFKACDKNINLEIYTCISKEDLERILQSYKDQGITDPKELANKLNLNQPTMNSTVEVYDKAVISIQKNINNYIKFHGFKMANSSGDANDWHTEFLIKYWYNVNFYRTRWFFPEKLKKVSKVKHKPMLYKDFLYQSKAIISNERRLRAHHAARNQDDSVFKNSLDKNYLDSKRSLHEIIANNSEFDETEINVLKAGILEKASIFEDGKYFESVKKALLSEEVNQSKPEGKLILVFAYMNGIVSEKTLSFVENLSTKARQKYGISEAKLKHQRTLFDSMHNKFADNKYLENVISGLSEDKLSKFEQRFAKEQKEKSRGRKSKK